VGIGLLMAIQNVVLPLPSELIMPLAGFLAGQGRLTFWGVILAGTLGGVLGTIPIYAIGRAFGEARIAAWLERHGRWGLPSAAEIRHADRRFQQRGGWAVFFAQLLPGVRGLIALPAGVAQMNVALFVLANVAGNATWCTVLALVGEQFGARYQKVHRFLAPVAWTVVLGIVVTTMWWIIKRRRSWSALEQVREQTRGQTREQTPVGADQASDQLRS